jgi:hypothetical protein
VLYLSPPTGSPKVHDAMRAGRLGLIATPAQGNDLTDLIAAGVPYAMDNGRFGDGWPGTAAWRGWVRRTVARYGQPLFVVVPDCPFDAVGTLEWWGDHLDTVRLVDAPAAFAAQNGSENGLVPWQDLRPGDVLFLAGDTEWKLGPAARALTREALGRGLLAHMGRVNGENRFAYADAIGCGTADGGKLRFGPDENLPLVLAWDTRVTTWQPLFDVKGLNA